MNSTTVSIVVKTVLALTSALVPLGLLSPEALVEISTQLDGAASAIIALASAGTILYSLYRSVITHAKTKPN